MISKIYLVIESYGMKSCNGVTECTPFKDKTRALDFYNGVVGKFIHKNNVTDKDIRFKNDSLIEFFIDGEGTEFCIEERELRL